MNPSSLDVLHVEIATLELRANDCLVVRLREPVSPQELEELSSILRGCLPTGVKGIVIGIDAELTVVRKGETLFDGADV